VDYMWSRREDKLYSDLDSFFRGDGNIDKPRPQGLQKGALIQNLHPSLLDHGISLNYKAMIDEIGGGYVYFANDQTTDFHSHNYLTKLRVTLGDYYYKPNVATDYFIDSRKTHTPTLLNYNFKETEIFEWTPGSGLEPLKHILRPVGDTELL